jgi:ribosome maturation factor RimP
VPIVSQDTTLERIFGLVSPVLHDMSFELVDLEFKREGKNWLLRLFIDKPGGITLDDCVDVSREVGALLEVEDVIESSYRLEVSSPGLDRPLKKAQDYERFCGELVKIKTHEKLDPDSRGYERKTFVGKLLGYEDGRVRILQVDKKGGEIVFSLEDIAKTNLEPEF